ncbi:hypothetical protein H4R99_003441 [Coemansia sp. RSA 1722]|nr:hypothetical protein LPJ57_000648 [Coemansia sp. RSA 486]KAJ2232213.1 hypothetical protein IWW45_005131 [Coemansia sp. RSA 485]KAJ2600152.1 hypothetical protein H4R99_003441 [Coemansia sp. RSA 1722]KAJ2602717.1 hypothetical protein GGF39_000595 [Coemansia sp. RSA 1721]KAJ2640231.1 hypothetical protein GGF40_000130 [Coemansia sp. RSA 1286]
MALDAQLMRYAQERAEYLADNNVQIADNKSSNQTYVPQYNSTYWIEVSENLLQTANNPTFAYWEFQNAESSAQKLSSNDYMFFGVGVYKDYYVQAFGIPVNPLKYDSELFPVCTANETFYNWVYPNGITNEEGKSSEINNTPFPFQAFADNSPVYASGNIDYDNGRTNDANYYFSSPQGTVPYLKDLEIPETVSKWDSESPYQAVADSGIQGMTKDELNLMVCLINSRRYDSCLAPVALHPQLIASAQAHSYEINNAMNMSQYGPSGPLGQRIRRRGFDFETIGENIISSTHDVYNAFVVFSETQGQLDNILSESFTFLGAGRSGQFWVADFASYAGGADTPDPLTVPLCPGNETAISIAFPNGLPSAPKIQEGKCGNTQATEVVPPPYIQSMQADNPTDTGASPNVGGPGVQVVTMVHYVTEYVASSPVSSYPPSTLPSEEPAQSQSQSISVAYNGDAAASGLNSQPAIIYSPVPS